MRFFTPANLRKSVLGSSVIALKISTAAASGSSSDVGMGMIAIAAVFAGFGLIYCCIKCCSHMAGDGLTPRERDDIYPSSDSSYTISVGNSALSSTQGATSQQNDTGDSYVIMPADSGATSTRPQI